MRLSVNDYDVAERHSVEECTATPRSVKEIAAMIAGMRRIGVRNRAMISQLLREVMTQQPMVLGLWCVFEPLAFDHDDASYVAHPGHDSTGRFAPRWHRNEGDLKYDCSQGHDSEELGGWYALTRDTRQEVVFGPYDENILTGLPVLCLSRVAPILERDEFIGAVGIDVSLDEMWPKGHSGESKQIDALETHFARSHVWVQRDGRLVRWSERAQRLLTRYFRRSRNQQLPAELAAWLGGIQGQAQSGVFSNDGEREKLIVHAVPDPHTGWIVLSLEEQIPSCEFPRAAAAGLSKREQEVLFWLVECKSNSEIAIILGLSEHTVRHHLERIFVKLGVTNRRAAMAQMQGLAERNWGIISRVA